nr:hypothetical protein [Tanacetum cinerariifolium]
EDLGKLKPKADIRIFISYAPTKKAFWIYNKRTRLVPNPPSLTPNEPPTNKDWDIMFQPMFDEYFNPLLSLASLIPVVVALVPTDSSGSPSSCLVDQDTPSPRTLQTPQDHNT